MRTSPIFAKSKLMSGLQCHKKLWLELHQTGLGEEIMAPEAAFAIGHTVGQVARQLYDPKGQGIAIDVAGLGTARALVRTKEFLRQRKPVFEAGFSVNGALAFADVLLPVRR